MNSLQPHDMEARSESFPQAAHPLREVTSVQAMLLDSAGRVVMWNAGMEQAFGIAAHEIDGKRLEDVFLPDSGCLRLRELLHEPQCLPVRETLILSAYNGRRRSLDLYMKQPPCGGAALLAVGNVLPVDTARPGRDGDLLDLSTRLADCRTLEEAEKYLRHHLKEMYDWDGWYLSVYDQTSDRFCVLAWCDVLDGSMRCWTGYRPMLRQPDEPELVRYGIPQLLNRNPGQPVQTQRTFFGDSNRPSMSILVVPVRSAGETIGLFSIQSYTPNKYNPEHADFLSGVASLLAPLMLREQAVLRLRASEERSRFLFDSNPSLVVLLSTSLTVLQVNEPGARFLGYSPDELINTPFETLCADFRHFADHLDHCRARPGLVLTRTHCLVSRDTSERMFRITLRCLAEEPDKEAFILSGQDETERHRSDLTRRRLDYRTRQRRKLESFSVLASGLSHDLSNTVTGIQGNASLALMDLQPTHPAWTNIRRIEAAASTAAELARSLLSIAGKTRIRTETVSMGAFLQRAAPRLRETLPERIGLQIEPPAEDTRAVADPRELELVLRHLIANAVDACPPDTLGGQVTIRAETRRFSPEELDTLLHHEFLREGSWVCLEVRDEGAGMLPRVRDRMFDPFFTTRSTGRGLGLAIVLGIVRAHGGGIGVETAPGRGTLVRVILPTAGADATPYADETTPASERLVHRSARILVCGEETSLTAGLESLLEVIGHSPVICRSRPETLTRLMDDPPPEVVVLDCAGNEGGTLSFLDEILARSPRARVIVLRGAGESETSQGVSVRPAVSILRKPFTAAELTTAIARSLSGPPATGS